MIIYRFTKTCKIIIDYSLKTIACHSLDGQSRGSLLNIRILRSHILLIDFKGLKLIYRYVYLTRNGVFGYMSTWGGCKYSVPFAVLSILYNLFLLLRTHLYIYRVCKVTVIKHRSIQ